VQLPARFLMASNSLPNFGSHTLAMSTRLVTLPFDVSFEGREDFELDAKLAAELPGILNWALDGLDDLRLSGRFANPPASEEAKRQLLRRSNILQSFVEEHCDLAPSHEIDKAIFRKAYTAFCYDADARPSPENKLTEEMRLLFAGTKATKRRAGADTQIPIYTGIRLKGEHALRYFEHDPEMLELGCTPYEALTLDAHGAPIPHKVSDFDFD
jgi:putative DNA primase/helicase